MSPVALSEVGEVAAAVPVGPITAGRGRKKASRQESKDGHGCPLGFVRPDLASRCTWRPNQASHTNIIGWRHTPDREPRVNVVL